MGRRSGSRGRTPERTSLRRLGFEPGSDIHNLSRLLDTQTRDGPADHELLDLLGAFEDVVGPAEGSTW
ncbi:MAG: hypothetical protein ACI8Y4_005254 [Candidatus Poriferisodalaceae bacterium]